MTEQRKTVVINTKLIPCRLGRRRCRRPKRPATGGIDSGVGTETP